MKTIIRKILLGCALLGAVQVSNAQCPNNNTLWGDITPTYDNQNSSWASITGVWGGDYYTVNVCAGATYTFTMCDNALVTYDAVMTLYNNTGGAALAFNDDHCGLLPQITWEATFTGTVRVLIDEFGCLSNFGPGMTLACYINSDCGTTAAPIGQVFGCNADVGTYTYTLNGVPFNPATEPAVLCAGNAANCVSVTSNQDWIQAPACDNNNFEVSEIMYAIYTCPPPATPDPAVDACYSGFLWSGQDYNQCGDAGIAGIIGSSNYWFIPITADDSDNGGDPNGVINFDQDGDGCYDTGTPIEIWEVNPITSGAVDVNCYNGVISFQVLGGQPEADGSNYVITNNANGTIVTGATTDGGYVILNGLNNGDAYNITIDDNVGSCPITVSGTYVACPCPTLDFTYTSPVQCDDPAQTLFADEGAMAAGEAITPCYYVQVIPSNAQAGNTIEFFENAVSLGVLNVTPNTNYSGFASYIDPTQTNTFELCDAAAGTNMQYYVIDCHSGNVITSGTWIADGSACQTVTVTPPSTNLNGTSSWAGTGITVTTNWGAAVFDPGVAGAGTHTITYTWDNGAGCSGTATNNITVQDAIPPTLTCPGNITVGNDAGNCSAVVNTPNPTLTDNCTALTLTWAMTGATTGTSPATGINNLGSQTFNVGTTTVTYTATDGANTVTCSFTVTVNDTENPVISCSGFAATFPADAGQCYFTLPGALSPVSMTDNCSAALTYAITGATTGSGAGNVPLGTQLNVGTNTITFTATDPAGNTASCTETITVIDSEAPSAACQNITVNLDASGNATITTGDIDNGSTDNCTIASMSLDVTSFDCTDLGANTVNLTVTDGAGNTDMCSATVTVVDNTAPVAACQNITVALDGTGNATITTGDIDNGSTDNCGIASMSLDVTSFDCTDVGPNTVTLTVTDAAGNSDNCTATVTIVETTPPVAACQNITVNLDAAGNATITTGDIDNGSTDNCGIASMSLDITSFDCTDVGANTVTLTVTDAAGNSDNCTATVTVVDNIAPIAACQNFTANLDATGNVTITTGDIDNGSSDNCGITSMSLDVTSFDCTDIGANTVTLTVTDAAGQTDNCTATVTVVDNLAPTVICQNITVPLDGTGNATITTGDIDNGSTDNCAIASMSLDITSFDCTDVGPNTVTLTVTDAAGNSDNCTATVTIVETTPPVAACQNITVNLDAAGNATITTGDIDNGSTDNCGIASMSLDVTSFDCTNIGANTVTLTVTDAAGNSDNCTATVTVVDPNVPTADAGLDDAICSGDTYTLGATSGGSASSGSWSTSGDGGFSSNTDPNAVYTPGPGDIAAGTVTLTWTTDLSPCSDASASMILTINETPTFTVSFGSNPSACGATDGTIIISGLNPNSTYDNLTYNDGTGTIVVGSFTTDGSGDYVITGLGAGGYSNFIVTLGPCTHTENIPIALSDPSAPTFTVAIQTHPSTCGGNDGEILISGLLPNTNYDITYDGPSGTVVIGTITTDASGNYVITGLSAGNHSNFVVDFVGCVSSDNTVLTLNDPTPEVPVAVFTSDPTSCGGTDGSITLTGLTPNTTYNFSYDDGTGTIVVGSITTDASGEYVITGLGADTYTNFSVTAANNCTGTDVNTITLVDPNAPTFTASFVSDPTTCGGADGVIEICGLTPSTLYDNLDYDDGSGTINHGSFTTDAAGCFQITGLAQDTYSNFMVTLAGCTGTDANSIVLTDPNAPTFTASFVSDPTTCGGADGVIEICGLTPSTLYDNLDYDNGSGTINHGSFTTDAAGCFQITGLSQDTYTNFIVTLAGCSGTDANSIALTDPNAPTFTASFVSDPTACGAADGVIEICGLTPSTLYDNLDYDNGSGTINHGSFTTDAAGCFQITGLSQDTYTNFIVTLTGCSGTDANSITLTDPNAPTFTASFISDPTTCGAADGVIEICGLTPSTTYDDLSYDDGSGTITVGSFTTDAAGCFQITGLVADTYSNFVVTLSSCVGTDANSITLTDPSITFTVTTFDPTTCGGTDGTITISGLSASTNYDISYDDPSGTVNLGTVTSDATGDYVITGLSAGNYSNILVQLGACSGSDAGPYVLTDPATPAAPIAGVDATYCIGDPVLDLTATAGSGGTLTWYSDPTPSGVLGTGGTYTPSSATGTTVYYVTETANGCESATSSVTITIESCVVLELIIPTGFTPDGDGVNDVWDIQNLNALYPNNVVRVFNRWGNMLFESNGYQTPWDGRHNGKDLPTGSYFFTIDFGDSSMTPESGSVTIIR